MAFRDSFPGVSAIRIPSNLEMCGIGTDKVGGTGTERDSFVHFSAGVGFGELWEPFV